MRTIKSEKEIENMYNEWKEIYDDFIKFNDVVSQLASRQTNAMLGVLEWVLDKEER